MYDARFIQTCKLLISCALYTSINNNVEHFVTLLESAPEINATEIDFWKGMCIKWHAILKIIKSMFELWTINDYDLFIDENHNYILLSIHT